MENQASWLLLTIDTVSHSVLTEYCYSFFFFCFSFTKLIFLDFTLFGELPYPIERMITYILSNFGVGNLKMLSDSLPCNTCLVVTLHSYTHREVLYILIMLHVFFFRNMLHLLHLAPLPVHR